MNKALTVKNKKDLSLLLAVLTLTPALVNWLALWLLNDAWLAIILSSVVFYGGAFWQVKAYGLEERAKLPAGKMIKSLGLGLISAGTVAVLSIWAGNFYFGKAIPDNMLKLCSQKLYQSNAFPAGLLQFFIFVAVILPVGEELYWRAGLQGLLARRAGFKRHILISALLFTVYHLVTISFLMPGWTGLPLVAIVFAGGLTLAWLTEHTGNIWAAVLCHGPGAWGATIYLIWKFLK
ncbi:MAG: CPBP family intramembrane glutamic endopeptidase [Candidatus Edwardsbacteria bacterium]|nr:CPBP family intramembrane glutamic endopeptidase [Candidatus Edwardsbacteria bacterium]